MDSLTQAALGAALGGATLGRQLGRKSLLAGAVVGSLPDLDVLIDYGDAVANVTYHRGFSHSLFVLTAVSLALAFAATRLGKRWAVTATIPALRWWLFFWLCLVTHPLLDSLTTYGTQLWWPLEVVAPSATPLVFIIDPVYTLVLLGALGVALWPSTTRSALQRAASAGLIISSLYLLAAMGAKSWVELRAQAALERIDMASAQVLVQPAPFSTLLWRVTAIKGDRHAEMLIGLLDGDTQPQVELFQRGAALEKAATSLASGQRLEWFAGPFLRYETLTTEDDTLLIATDLRLGFPGFHPFRFALARWRGDRWVALSPSRQLPMSAQQRPLGRLLARIISPQPRLCMGDYVAPRWHLATDTAVCAVHHSGQ